MKYIFEVGSNKVDRISSIIAYKVSGTNDNNNSKSSATLIKEGIIDHALVVVAFKLFDYRLDFWINAHNAHFYVDLVFVFILVLV